MFWTFKLRFDEDILAFLATFSKNWAKILFNFLTHLVHSLPNKLIPQLGQQVRSGPML
jgi:hypothetical protein